MTFLFLFFNSPTSLDLANFIPSNSLTGNIPGLIRNVGSNPTGLNAASINGNGILYLPGSNNNNFKLERFENEQVFPESKLTVEIWFGTFFYIFVF